MQATCADNLVKFGHVVFEICDQTERRHNDKLIAVLHTSNMAK